MQFRQSLAPLGQKGFRDGLNAPAVKSSDVEVLGAVKSARALGYVTSAPAGSR